MSGCKRIKPVLLFAVIVLAALVSSSNYWNVKTYLEAPIQVVSVGENRTTSTTAPKDVEARPATSSPSNSTIRSSSTPEPPFRVNRDPPKSPFLYDNAYQPTGGPLPMDPTEHWQDPHLWRFIDNTTCLKSDPPASWQYRAPYAILLGAMKAGTHAVIESLWEHPQVARTGHWELHFFDSPTKAIRSDKGIHRNVTLQNYAHAVQKAVGWNRSMMETSFVRRNMIMVESSPKYLIHSDRIPDFILCVTPWVKLLAILRDPLERVESHYRFEDENRRSSNKSMVDWHVWIQDDLRLLQQAGVLNATTPQEEYVAWKTYQRRPHSQQIIGRGLYIIQLEQYWQAMDRVGKPRSDFWVMQSEQFHKDRQGEYHRLLEFLELPPHQLFNASQEIHKTSSQATRMPLSIRQQLLDLYRPYNERLYKALSWERVWD